MHRNYSIIALLVDGAAVVAASVIVGFVNNELVMNFADENSRDERLGGERC